MRSSISFRFVSFRFVHSGFYKYSRLNIHVVSYPDLTTPPGYETRSVPFRLYSVFSRLRSCNVSVMDWSAGLLLALAAVQYSKGKYQSHIHFPSSDFSGSPVDSRETLGGAFEMLIII